MGYAAIKHDRKKVAARGLHDRTVGMAVRDIQLFVSVGRNVHGKFFAQACPLSKASYYNTKGKSLRNCRMALDKASPTAAVKAALHKLASALK